MLTFYCDDVSHCSPPHRMHFKDRCRDASTIRWGSCRSWTFCVGLLAQVFGNVSQGVMRINPRSARVRPEPRPPPLPRGRPVMTSGPTPLPPPGSVSDDLGGGRKGHEIRAKRETPRPVGGPYISECTAALGLFSRLFVYSADV